MSARRRSGSCFHPAAAAVAVDCAKCCNPIKKGPAAVCERCDRAWHPACVGIKHGGGSGGGGAREGAGRGWRCDKCSTETEGDRESLGAGDGDGDGAEDGEWEQPRRRQRQPRPAPPRHRQQSQDDDGYFWDNDNELACPSPDLPAADIVELKEKCQDMQKEIHNLKTENQHSRNALRRLKIRQEAQAQDVHSKNVEIQGLFERAGEDLVALVLRLFALKAAAAAEAAAATGRPLQYGVTSVGAEDIVSCTRLVHSALDPKPVVVTFRDKKKRDGVYRGRFCGRVAWRDLAQGGVAPATEDPERLAHVNPHLTPHFRRLLNLCRRVCQRQGLPAAACRYGNCKIYVQRREGEPPFAVEVAEDLRAAFPGARDVVDAEIESRRPGPSGPGAAGAGAGAGHGQRPYQR